MRDGFIRIGKNVFNTLFAISEKEQMQGLMNVKPPTPNMSFIYLTPRVNKFWMKSTPAPLDILFCINGSVSQIHQGEPFSTTSIGNNEFSDLVIELPLNTCKEFNLKVGDDVRFIKPTKEEILKIAYSYYL